MTRTAIFACILAVGFVGCGGTSMFASVPTPSPPPTAIVNQWAFGMPDSGATYTFGTAASLVFSSNDAPTQTLVTIAPLPRPTPKYPLPDQIAGYAVRMTQNVHFTSFPPVFCVNGSFAASQTYTMVVTDATGKAVAQAPGVVTPSNVCNGAGGSGGDMQANQQYSFVMLMSTSTTPASR